MNIDFKLPLSGRVARKLAYASTIMKIDIDAAIISHVDDDLLTSDEIHKHVRGTHLERQLTIMELGIIQFVVDCNCRAVVGTNTEQQSMDMLLLSALASGKNILIVDKFKMQGQTSWQRYMEVKKVPWVDGSNAQDGIDLNARIIMADEKSNLEYLKKKARDRVLVYRQHVDQSFFEMNDLFLEPGPGAYNHDFNLHDMCKDFEYAILGFNVVDHAGTSKQSWNTSMGFSTMMSCIAQDEKIIKAMSTDKAPQKALHDSGIMLTSPHHIAKMLNVNVDMIRASEEQRERNELSHLWDIDPNE